MYRLADGDAMMIPQRDAATWSCRLARGQAVLGRDAVEGRHAVTAQGTLCVCHDSQSLPK